MTATIHQLFGSSELRAAARELRRQALVEFLCGRFQRSRELSADARENDRSARLLEDLEKSVRHKHGTVEERRERARRGMRS